jgi:hypothetical protein
MPRQPLRLVTYAWGQQYIDKLLEYTLASVLAPNNLAALAEEFDCSVVIVTEKDFFDYIESHPIIKRIETICPVRPLPLDDLIGEPWQYGISLAYALFRGFAELGPAMTETYILFLNADFVLADGSYKRLIPYLRRGERVLLAPSYCTVAEEVTPLLACRRDPWSQTLAIPCREMARMILDHCHNTIRAKTINQNKVHFEYMDQAYWEVDKNTLLGRQMPISLVAMKPELAPDDINTFWDWGVVYEFCPSRKLTVIGDSDEFLMLELRDRDTHRDLIRLGPITPQTAASRMTGYITLYQTDAGQFPLTLHSKPLPGGVATAHGFLQAFIDELIKSFPSTPADHRDHKQWRYHKEHLQRYHEAKANEAQAKQLAAELARVEAERDREQSLIWRRREQALHLAERQFAEAADRLAARFDPLLTELRIRLETHRATENSAQVPAHVPAQVDDSVAEPVAVFDPIVRPNPTILTWIRKSLLGDVPQTLPWHPLHLAYRDILRALRVIPADRPINILLVANAGNPLALHVAKFPGSHFRASALSLLKGGLEKGMSQPPAFDFCIVELSRADLPNIRQLYEAVARCLCKDGQLLMYWINFAGESGAELERDFASCLVLRDPHMSISFVSSGSARLAVRLAQWASASGKTWQRASAPGALLAAAVCALAASLIQRSLRSTSMPSADCLGMVIEIRHKSEVNWPLSQLVEPSGGDAVVAAGVALD